MESTEIKKESMNNIKEVDDFLKEKNDYYKIEDLKVDVNNFLYSKVRSDMTILEFENLSIEVFKSISKELHKEDSND